MQIIITQSEIESAIKSYIMEQIHVKPNMTITIDLKATRGAEGATAIIDIAPTPASQAGLTVQEPKKEKAEPAPAKLFTAPVVAEVPAVTVDEAIASLPEVEAETPVLVPDAEVPVPARTSLFAGLKKPVNA